MDKTLFLDAAVRQTGDLDIDWNWLKAILAARWPGKKVILRIQAWTGRRSIAANNFYFGCIVKCLSDYTGYTKEETHALLKSRFATETLFVVNDKTGEVFEQEVPRQTRNMNTTEFAEYIENCIGLCVGLGIALPGWKGDKYAYYEET